MKFKTVLVSQILWVSLLGALGFCIVPTARADSQVGENDFRVSDVGQDGDATANAFNPALAYSSVGRVHLVVWSGDDPVDGLVDEEAEIFGQLIDADTGQELGDNDFRISAMCNPSANPGPCRARRPAVAYNSINNEFLVVWEGYRDTDVFEEFEIFAQRVSVSGEKLGGPITVSDLGPSGTSSYKAFEPDVAHNPLTNQYLVVWQGDDLTSELSDGENEIFGQRLAGSTGAEIGANDFRISDMGPNGDPLYQARDAAVAVNTTNNEFLVVWSGDDDTANANFVGEFEVYGQRISGVTGLQTGPNDFRISDMGSTGDPDFDANKPDVAYNSTNNEYLVVWSGDDILPGLSNQDFEIFGQRLLGATGVETGPNDFRISDLGPNGSAAYAAEDPSVAYNQDDNEYLVVWRGDDDLSPGGDQDFEIFVQAVEGESGLPIGSNDFQISDFGPSGSTQFPTRTPVIVYGAGPQQYLVFWQGSDDLPGLAPTETEIYGQRLTTVRDTDNDGVVDSVDLDDDNDGLSDVLELGTYFTNPFNPDTDSDGVSDGDEVSDRTDPLDRGSKQVVLGRRICLEWNGFLSPILNIKELVGLGANKLTLTSTLFSLAGLQQSVFNGEVGSGGQFDLLVHGMPGFVADSYGQVCTRHNGNPGDLDGRMVYYKLSPGQTFENGVEYAFALPFSAGEPGEQFVPFNTFQPSLLNADSQNLVANWIQVSSLNVIPESGQLSIYGQAGELLCRRALTLAPNQRIDSAAHAQMPGDNCPALGPQLVGVVSWKPNNPAARFIVRNVRYLYNNPVGANQFTTAFQLEATPGTGRLISAPVDRRAQTVVLELTNVAAVENSITYRIYDSAGQVRFAKTQVFAPRATVHVILDDSNSANGLGQVEVDGTIRTGVLAVLMHYGRPQSSPLGLRYLYGLPLIEAVTTVQRGSYNTFLGQGCTLYLANPGATAVSANVRLVRFDGSVIVPGDSLVVPKDGAIEYNCARDIADRYGVLTLQSSAPLAATVVRKGPGDRYRFPTTVR